MCMYAVICMSALEGLSHLVVRRQRNRKVVTSCDNRNLGGIQSRNIFSKINPIVNFNIGGY